MGIKKGIEKQMQHWDTLKRGNGSNDPDLQKIWDSADRVGQDFQPDVEQGLRRLKQKMSTAHDTKVVKLAPRRYNLTAIAAAVALLLVGWALWLNGNSDSVEPTWIAISTSEDEKREVVLPDGSTVTLNENSELQYVSNLNGLTTRDVQLTGEAFFDVARRPEQPFVITADFVEVEVLGTSFNVLARSDANFAEVEVSSGQVAVRHPYTQEQMLLAPNEKAVLQDQLPIQKATAPHLNSKSWQTGQLKFRATPLSTALPAIERHYDIRLEVASKTLLTCPFTTNWVNAELSEVLASLFSFTGEKVQEIGPNRYRIGGRCR